jgi:hypothetical protein
LTATAGAWCATPSCQTVAPRAALQLHVDVASAIQRGSGEDAHSAMLGIMARTFAEMSSLWEQDSTD